MWFDSHCHLHICELDASLDELLANARSAGVDDILTAGIDVESSMRSVELAERDGVYAAVGLHPNSADVWSADVRVEIEKLLDGESVVAVGESGLDFYRDDAPPEMQAEAFTAHVEMAKTHDKALIIHTRSSIEQTLELLERVGPPPRLVFHCWSGEATHLERANQLDAYISFAGNVSFKNAEDLRVLAASVPEERLLVETDSPYLSPMPHRGKPNEPARVADVGAAVAAARGVTPAEVARSTTANAKRFFAIG